MKESFLIISLLLLGLFACSKKVKSAKTASSPTPEEKAATVATKIYQKNYQVEFNSSKTVACISKSSKKKAREQFPTLSFVLYDLETEKILFKETIARATGQWKSDHEFEVTVVPERVGRMATLEKNKGWIFDLKTRKKVKK